MMKVKNETQRALGGPGLIVQIDETMLNYKCKSLRGRSPENHTDALCIVEVGEKIQKVWIEIILDKKNVYNFIYYFKKSDSRINNLHG
jgi:hypothetical protein